MTDQDRTLWAAAQDDYTKALKIAAKAWDAADPPLIDVTPEALQAAAATILIHITKLRHEPHVVVKVPSQGASGHPSGKGDVAPPFDPGSPACPSCGGPMEDKRDSKRSDKAPDFVCLQSVRPCGKPSKDGKYFNKTGRWIEPANGTPKPKAQGAVAGVAAGRNFNEMPETLAPEDDELPF